MRIHAFYFLFFLLSWGESKAQPNILKPDQNPKFMESVQYYRVSIATLPNTEGVTLQQTYKAYDWYEARLKRRQQRHQRQLHQYPDHRLFYYHRFPYHYYWETPFPRRSPRHSYFWNTLPYHY